MATINTRERSGVAILKISGRIEIGVGAFQLREAVHRALEEGKKSLLLELSEVTYIDSSGLGELVSSYSTTSHRDGRLKLLKPTKKILDLLTLTKLITVFEIFEDEDEAVKSFS